MILTVFSGPARSAVIQTVPITNRAISDIRSVTEAGDALSAHLSARRSQSGPKLKVV